MSGAELHRWNADRPVALCHFSMIEVDPPQLVTIAADAGFSHVSLMLHFPPGAGSNFPILGDTAMRRETLARLNERRIGLIDASTCRLRPDTQVETFEPMFETAALLGAQRFNVNGDDPDESRLADRFAELAEIAAVFGLSPSIEFMMISQVRTVQAARQLIASSGVGDAAITLDATHIQRSRIPFHELRALPPDRISYLQLSDGPPDMPPERLAWEAGKQRLLPGEGSFPLEDLIRSIPPGTPLGIEAPSEARLASGESAAAYALRARHAVDMLLARCAAGD